MTYTAEVFETQALREPKPVRAGRAVHVNVLLLAHRSLEAAEEICQSEGITHSQYVALWTLCLDEDADTGIPIGAVADGLLNRASVATRLIDRLERAALAARLRNPNDRRSVLVRAAAEGRRICASVTPKLQEYHRHQWSNPRPPSSRRSTACSSKRSGGKKRREPVIHLGARPRSRAFRPYPRVAAGADPGSCGSLESPSSRRPGE